MGGVEAQAARVRPAGCGGSVDRPPNPLVRWQGIWKRQHGAKGHTCVPSEPPVQRHLHCPQAPRRGQDPQARQQWHPPPARKVQARSHSGAVQGPVHAAGHAGCKAAQEKEGGWGSGSGQDDSPGHECAWARQRQKGGATRLVCGPDVRGAVDRDACDLWHVQPAVERAHSDGAAHGRFGGQHGRRGVQHKLAVRRRRAHPPRRSADSLCNAQRC
mmetsp:Transcript_56554/g.138800  ORF Transcript_56554/g.138800 Transcript_56554/m.138800 type:complete len:215 (-) Transcript_56554:163-807(-)